MSSKGYWDMLTLIGILIVGFLCFWVVCCYEGDTRGKNIEETDKETIKKNVRKKKIVRKKV